MMLSVARGLMATAGRPVAVRGVALAGAVAIPAAIIFSHNGLRAHDVVLWMHASLAARGVLWLGWIALATPVAASAFGAPGTRTLRSLRIAPLVTNGLLVALLALTQAPWALLFLRGEGPMSALASACAAVAVEASALALSRSRPRSWFLLGASAALIAADVKPTWAALAFGPLAFFSTRLAWKVALDESSVVRIVVRSHPIVTLALAYVARMVRSSRSRLQAATLVMISGGGALALTLRNDPDARPFQRALVVLTTPMAIACALLAQPAVEAELRLRPILRAIRVRPFTLAFACAFALAAPTSALAATSGAIAVAASHVSLTLVPALGLWSVPIACSVAVWARRSFFARRSSNFVVGVVLLAIAWTALGAIC